MYTVVSREKPPTRHRALAAGVLALILATALAATLVRQRTTFPVTYQVPEGWRMNQQVARGIEYRDSVGRGQLIIRTDRRPPSLSAMELAYLLMAEHLEYFADRLEPAEPETAPLGQLPGARVSMPETGDYIHVGLPPADPGRMVVVRYHTDGPFSEDDLETVADLVESVRIAG
ncbi:MAG: hypothetical protein GY842_06145 [bacterium]|nr:hypothetical protein [bacterium]